MAYNLIIPYNDQTIYPFKRTRYIETVVRNMTPTAMVFGFLRAHGKRLKAYGDPNGQDFYVVPGNLENELRGIPGHRYKRLFDHYLNALANNIIRVTVNHRDVYYGAVSNNTAFNPGDLCYFNSTANQVQPASQFAWNTNLATTQAGFAAAFVGVCLDTKVAGDGQTVLRFDRSPLSAFDFTLSSTGTVYQINQGFAPAQAAGGANALVQNQVAPAVGSSACLRLVSDVAATDTQALLAPAAAFFPENAAAQIG